MGDSYIIAIDFGTAYSGYAYSLTSREEESHPYVKLWGTEVGIETPKAPTCILFDEHKQFLEFGYKAQKAYIRMYGENPRKCYFFEFFKMALYGRTLNRDLTIKAANGKEMNALKVFTAALCYMKDDSLKTINKNTNGKTFIASDFTWVLTVPAIWDPSAKQFMREAATEAGIVIKGNEDKLVVALEPEAASIWCKKLPADGFIAQNSGKCALDQSPGTQYIVVDCGGGTIDITVHEVLDGGALKELHKASGNDLGGQTVDKKFKEFLREVFSNGVWDKYIKQHPGELLRLMSDFVVLKKNDDDVEIFCPLKLGTMAKEVQDVEKFFKTVQGASWNDGSIKITKDKMKSFFDESLIGTTNSLREIFKKDFNIEYILLVGGYAESQVLRQHITDMFGQNCTVLCPFRPQEAIVKGAVMFGKNPEMVASRKSAFTYGIAISMRFDESKHRKDKKYSNKNGVWCHDIFEKLVQIDEDVGWDESREHILFPIEDNQLSMKFLFYCTERENLVYVDEWGIKEIGSFVIKMPDIRRGLNRKVKLKITFGATEMKATGIDMETGSRESIKLDFMTKFTY